MMLLTLGLLSAAFVISLVVVALVRRHAIAASILDRPNERSSHDVPTPRGGGIGIVIAFLSVLAALCAARAIENEVAATLGFAAAVIACAGYFDDLHSLRASWRFGAHLLAASLFVGILGGLPADDLARWGMTVHWVGIAFVVIVLVWATNLFNFMDGIDGIAALEAIFMTVAGAAFHYLSGGDPAVGAALLGLAGGLLGFLVWNWAPARIFMGDVGSGFLGFTVTALAILSSRSSRVPPEVWTILGGTFIVDATVTLIRRAARGESWLQPHRLHAYQHLARRWKSHARVTLAVAAVNLFWLTPWAYVANQTPQSGPLIVAVALLPIAVICLICGSGKLEVKP
jgi:Fuc2NAc and GlcNAc transferase